jgi:hypothetical protein
MRKRDELSDPNSCLNKAADDEFLFVLLARDEDAPETIRFWARRRVARGKRPADHPQIVEALASADRIEAEQLRSPHHDGPLDLVDWRVCNWLASVLRDPFACRAAAAFLGAGSRLGPLFGRWGAAGHRKEALAVADALDGAALGLSQREDPAQWAPDDIVTLTDPAAFPRADEAPDVPAGVRFAGD